MRGKHPVEGEIVSRLAAFLVDRIGKAGLSQRFKRLLLLDFRVHFDPVKVLQPAVKVSQLLVKVNIAVEIDPAVGRMIELFMKIGELLICQLRNMIRISSGFFPVDGVREKQGVGFSV